MPKTANKTDKILKKLKKSGSVNILNTREHFEAQKEMNKIMEETRKEYKKIEIQSQISASKVILAF